MLSLTTFTSAYAALDGIRGTVLFAEPGGRDALRRAASATVKAAAYVALAASLERFLCDFSTELRLRVIADCSSGDVLRTELIALAADGLFGAARDPGRSALLVRTDILRVPTMAIADWPESASFSDGKTVDSRTFVSIWRVLGLDGEPFPEAAHRVTLDQIRARRNRLAHGETTFELEGRRVTSQDVLRDISRVRDQLEHVDVAVDGWLRQRGWAA